MDARPTVPCKTCGKPCANWRQCPNRQCDHDIAYCVADGGDELATKEMAEHISKGHAKNSRAA